MPKKRQPPAAHPPAKKQPLATYLRPACLSCATALVVAAPLVPSERTELTGAALPQSMLWLLLALVWFAGAWLTRQPLRRFDLVDFAALAFAGWVALSGVVMLRYGSPRLTINAIWTWAGMICAFLLLRQLLRSEREMRAACAVMIGVAVCLSVVAIHQTFFAYPQMRELYRRDPEAALRQAEVHAPAGSIQRKQFEDRLHSTEPNATFSLTNSLAGFVAPWLVLLVAVASSRRVFSIGDETRRLEATATWLIALPIVVCLLLTKSRSAWLATLLGLIAVALAHLAGGHRPAGSQRLAILATVVVIAAVSVMLAAIGIFDIDIVAQAGRSLAFRLEYWQATLTMIADYPLLGVGPGNFQEYYTAYKLPQASETIADPHNFAFELAAIAGVPALLAFVAVVAFAVQGMFAAAPPSASVFEQKPNELADLCVRSMYSGACAAIPLAAMLGLVMGYMPDMLPLLLGAAVAALAVWLLHGWVERGALPRWVIAVAIGVLLVNLLAAGGIGFPGVAITLWVLLAIAGGQRPATNAELVASRWLPAIGALVAAALLLACYATAYRPVLARMLLLGAAADAQASNRFDAAIDFAEDAAAADLWSAEPHWQLAQMYYEKWRARVEQSDVHTIGNVDDDADFQAFERHAAAALALNPRSSTLNAALAYLKWEAFSRAITPRLMPEAEALLDRSVELAPGDAMAYAQQAWMANAANRPAVADKDAAEALRLDALCPHSERKLAQRRLFAEVASPAQIARMPADLRELNAEQWMHRLRKD